MASKYFGIEHGETYRSVTESASTTGKGVEIVIDESKITTLSEINVLLKQLEVYFQQDKRYR